MELLKTVFKSSESWNEKLLEESLLNVALYLMKKNFTSIKLRVLVPYRKKSKRNKSYTFTQEEEKQMQDETIKFHYAADFYSAEVTNLVVQMLGKVTKNSSHKFRYSELTTVVYPIYDEDLVGSITEMLGKIKTDIDEGKEDNAHVIYIIDSSLVKGIPYESEIPFVNYVVI